MTTRPTTISVTGQRSAHGCPKADSIIRRSIRQLVVLYPNALWLTGGAIGADQIATDELLNLKQRVQLVLPFPVDVQSARWAPTEREVLVNQIARVESVEIVYKVYHNTGYDKRNKRLVSRAKLLVAFWDGIIPYCGTASTVYTAVRYGVPVYWVSLR
jgi:uncharacterized phage-like protein YoqJ